MLTGVDVAQAELNVATRPGGERWTAANDERGVHLLVDRLWEHPQALIVLEATGGYELLCSGGQPASGARLRLRCTPH